MLDLTQAWAGPFTTMILGDLGAEVIKIESKRRPDVWRGGTDAYQKGVGEPGNRPFNRNALLNSVGRNKQGITLDLATDRGRELFLRLVAISDVVVENFTPRVMLNFGLGYGQLAAVRPGLIMLSMPAYGDWGPYSDYPGIGGTIEPMAGNSALIGASDGPPMNSGTFYPDPVAGLFGAAAVLLAFRARRKDPLASHYVNLSQHEAMISLLGGLIVEASQRGGPVSRQGDRDPEWVPSGNYECGDGRFVALSIGDDEDWRALAGILRAAGLPVDESWASSQGRRIHRSAVDEVVGRWCRGQTAMHAETVWAEAGLAAGMVRTVGELASCPQLRDREFFHAVPHSELGQVLTAGMAWRLSGTPGSLRSGPPCLGEHSREVLRRLLALDAATLDELEALGITGDQPPEL